MYCVKITYLVYIRSYCLYTNYYLKGESYFFVIFLLSFVCFVDVCT